MRGPRPVPSQVGLGECHDPDWRGGQPGRAWMGASRLRRPIPSTWWPKSTRKKGSLHDLRIEAEALIEHVLGQTHPSRVWVGRPSGSSKPPSVPEHGAVSLGWIEARLEELARGSRQCR